MKKLILILLAAIVVIPACKYTMGERVKGNGNVRTEDRSTTTFRGVSSFGPFDIVLSQDSGFKVNVEAEENLLPYIETYVEADVLHIRTKEGYRLDNRKDVRVHVSAPSFSTIKTVGSGNITTGNKLMNNVSIVFEATGSGDIKADLNAPEVRAEITGSGNIILSGETKNFKGEINGSGDIRAMDLQSETSTVDIFGSGNAAVFASVKLNVEVNGSGDVKYKGNGQVSSSIHGSGSVKKVD